MTLLITENDISKLPLSARAAISIVEDTFHQAGEGTAETPTALPYALQERISTVRTRGTACEEGYRVQAVGQHRQGNRRA